MNPHISALRRALRTDLTSSLVVFLVALPLCVGVAVASGVPAELGLITGIVGGLVTGLLPGSSLQVSGPAAGLTVLVYAAVIDYGLAALGVIVLASGLLQLLLGALHLGRWFRAISLSVVQGMLAGIGLVLIAGQLYALADRKAPGSGTANLTGLPGLAADTLGSDSGLIALTVGVAAVAVMTLWKKLPAKAQLLPGPLAAVGAATGATVLFDLPIARVEVNGLLASVQPPGSADFGRLAELGLVGTVVAFTLIASAESLFSAAAVDRLHDGPRTDYDKELMAQGAGNTVCGLLGALPMTAVIVRSAANVQASARTKLSRVLHGVWLLLFAALLPDALGVIPTAALAGVLVHAGFKLLPVKEIGPLWREHRGEAVVLLATALAILATNMFEGVLIGLLLAVAKTAWDTSHVHVEITDPGVGPVRISMIGNATFLRLPRILDALDQLPRDRSVDLNLTGLRHLDHACMTALQSWADQHNAHSGQAVRVIRAG
ncbi:MULTISPECIES: SulP family inorganic anion transporter [unclassified Streptomyces]|uniref:SulP family inorganic anion transporter n=1 Tax=unclassified Streptomyces TaxID=2593676 RepID=UPI002E81AF81|nr:SulP family inorganic anion transporter [Streptomyces sp. NBC_00589]WTI35031.1 SulP family inorganic anion transporter [Streptomyces sp. NBC_00775]WUB31295.1 SulP family inorganic anion transporter [Streptomyces sp. NBC_00589]